MCLTERFMSKAPETFVFTLNLPTFHLKMNKHHICLYVRTQSISQFRFEYGVYVHKLVLRREKNLQNKILPLTLLSQTKYSTTAGETNAFTLMGHILNENDL